MAILVSVRVERKTLRSLCEMGPASDYLWSTIREDHFGYEPYREAFKELSKMYAKNGRVPTWDVFVDNPKLSEDTRKILQKVDTSTFADSIVARDAVEVLNEQRESRLILNLLEEGSDKIGKESPEDIKAAFQDALSTIMRTDGLDEMTWNSGAGKEARLKVRKKLREMLTPKNNRVIPTGFSAFDSVNMGIQRGTCMLIGGPTGTGKSLISTIMGINMATRGARVLKVTLEMTFEHEMVRVLAALAAIPAVNINNPTSLSEELRETLLDVYSTFDRRLHKNGGCFDLLVPTAGLRMEQLLAWLRSQTYDCVIIDYLGLMEGLDESDQMWRAMGNAVKQAAIYTLNTNTVMCVLVQVTDDGMIRYSRAVEEHAPLSWMWKREERQENKKEKDKENGPKTTPKIHIIPRKSRNHKPVEFSIYIDFDIMQASCDSNMLGTPFIDALFPQEPPMLKGARLDKKVRRVRSGAEERFESMRSSLKKKSKAASRHEDNRPVKKTHSAPTPMRKGKKYKSKVTKL